MATLVESLRQINKPWQWIAIGIGTLLIWAAVATPVYQTRTAADQALRTPSVREFAVAAPALKAGPTALQLETQAGISAPELDTRKIIRTSSMEMVTEQPAEVVDKITVLAEALGGYVETSSRGGQNATSANLTIRVPSAQFDRARTEIHKLSLRVENERVDGQDVTRQYVDQGARIRNLRAEEAGFLAILKQATTVKDMLAVSERLSEVRGEIERQQAEFNALSKQVETVSIAISLRTESEAQLFGLNWRPLQQVKLAAHDGLESLGTYATAMTTILFFLPATALWVGTILLVIIASLRIVQWVNGRWFSGKTSTVSTQS